MATNPFKFDDPLGFVRPVQDGATEIQYPFLMNGDTAPRIYSRSVLQREANYVALKPGTETDSVWPDGDAKAYSLPDGPTSRVGIGDLLKFSRSYARIPGTQVTYPGSRYIPLPAIPNEWQGLTSLPSYTYPNYLYIGDGFYSSTSSVIYTNTNRALYGPTKACASRLVGYATAGTFTLTFGASTTAALNWNDSGATIATAINGLASVSAAGLTCTASNSLSNIQGGVLDITWTVGRTTTSLTLNGGSLTVTTSNHPVTFFISNVFQSIRLADHITVTGHGLNTALAIATVQGQSATSDIQIISTGSWGSIDANTLWMPTVADVTTANNYQVVGTYNRTYEAGRIYLMRIKLTEDFFLPGVTVGITTASDIPISIGLQNPADFISALATLTGWQTYETEGPAFWLNGPIYRRAYTAINISDIV